MQKKIQVMLVDDEYLAIEDLKTLIDWNALGFEICATARSGRQALHAFESAPADLVITDISMPGMNGITLVEQLQQKNPRLLFLLLTAYAEINYMKSAFQLGVEDYLIKNEITPAILQAKLYKIREKYLASLSQSYSFLQKKLRKYFSDSSCAVARDLPEISHGSFLYCILAPDMILPWIEDLLISQKFSIPRIIDTAMPLVETYQYPGIENYCSVSAYNNKIIILLRMSENISTSSLLEKMQHFSDSLVQELWRQCALSFSAFYSYIPMDLERIHEDFFSKQRAVRARYFLGGRLRESLDSPRLFIHNEKIALTEDDLKNAFEKAQPNLIELIEEMFDTVIAGHNYHGLSLLVNVCFSFLSKRMENPLSLEDADLTDIAHIRAFIIQAVKELYENHNPDLPYEVKRAIQYIEDHFSEESLSIQEIAEEIGLSSTHLSRVFKTATGDTVWDYLTKLRIRKACRILRTSNAKIYEVAEMTGYASPQYFSQVFYKQIGVKPLDYRKKERT
ncbi:response regulator [Lachnospiraceae bacterium JLR.KK008]